MVRSRGRGRGRGRGNATTGPARPRSTTTRNRGRPPKQPSVASTNGSTRGSQAAKKRNKGLTVNGKKPWDDSDEEVYEKPDYLSNSDEDDEDEDDQDHDYIAKADVSEEVDEDYEELRSAITTPVYNEIDEPQPCPWAEDIEFPMLELPRASFDLLTTNEQILDLIQIYETLLTYYQAIQLTPFIFEDFCAAMRSLEPTKLVADIHVALLKCLLRDDDDEQTIYAVTDTSVSFQLVVHCLDGITYAEFLRQYVESDVRFPQNIAQICRNNYPYGPIEDKITVLLWLTDRFFETGCFRKIVKAEGKIVHNVSCRECLKPGDVILCDNCDACYHLKCANLDEVPPGTWFCLTCQMNAIHGATDCFLPGERIGKTILNRMPLGYDRHGRIYWFCVRRLIVTDPNTHETRFYSTLPAIFDVILQFDPLHYEARLCRAIYPIIDSIADHTLVTLQLSRHRHKEMKEKLGDRGHSLSDSYLDKDNMYRMMYLTYVIVNNPEFHPYHELSLEPLAGDMLRLNLLRRFVYLLGFEDGNLVKTEWTFGIKQEQLLSRRIEFLKAMKLPLDTLMIPYVVGYITELNVAFRLGFSDQAYRNYENFYETNDNTKPPPQRVKEKDRRKYLGTRFCLEEPFNWAITKGRDMYCSELIVIRHIQITLRRFVDHLPVDLFHRLWRGQNKEIFMRKLQAANDVEGIKQCLLQFEAVIRRPVFVNPWWSSLGHTKLLRVTTTDRDKKHTAEVKRKKADRDLTVADVNDASGDIIWVKTDKRKPQNKTILRVRGEQYRVNGRDKLGGWQWVSNEYRKRHVETLEKPQNGIDFATGINKDLTKASRKAVRLDKIVKKLTNWRETQVSEAQSSSLNCFSPTCRKPYGSTVNGVATACYAASCPRRSMVVEDLPTSAIVKAFLPSQRRLIQQKRAKLTSERTPGEGISFRFPRPFTYHHRVTNRPNILVLPQYAISKMARTAGTKLTPLPGFNRNAKTNYSIWNYPCPRPLFDTCWRYLTHKATTIHALAMQIRMLFSSIRWIDLEPDWEPEDPRHVVHHPEHDEIRVVIGHKEFPPDGFYERYKMRIELVALEEDGIPPVLENDVVISTGDDLNDEDSKKEPQSSAKPTRKSTRRKSTRKATETALYLRNNVSRRVVERWMDGIDLKLFEIAEYWRNLNAKREKKERKVVSPPPALKKIEIKPPRLSVQPKVAPARPPKPTPIPESRKRGPDAFYDRSTLAKRSRPTPTDTTISVRRGDSIVKYRLSTPTSNTAIPDRRKQTIQVTGGRQFQVVGTHSPTIYTPAPQGNGNPMVYSVVRSSTPGGPPLIRAPGNAQPIRVIRQTVNGTPGEPGTTRVVRVISRPGEGGEQHFVRVNPYQGVSRTTPRFAPAYVQAIRPSGQRVIMIPQNASTSVVVNGTNEPEAHASSEPHEPPPNQNDDA